MSLAALVITVAVVLLTWVFGLGGLNQDVEHLQRDMTEVKQEVASLQEDVSDLQVDLATARGEIGAIRAILERLEADRFVSWGMR